MSIEAGLAVAKAAGWIEMNPEAGEEIEKDIRAVLVAADGSDPDGLKASELVALAAASQESPDAAMATALGFAIHSLRMAMTITANLARDQGWASLGAFQSDSDLRKINDLFGIPSTDEGGDK